ncbi:MAG: hypothetical protein ACC726_09315 [Chloroflexota bacterium]
MDHLGRIEGQLVVLSLRRWMSSPLSLQQREDQDALLGREIG